MTVFQPDKVHRIDEDVIKVFLLAAAADVTYSLKDPATDRPATSKFISTSYPVRPVRYPIVVIELINSSGKRLDVREDIFQHTASIRYLARGKIKTHCHMIINGIEEVLERRHRDLSGAGLAEMKVTGASNVIWEPGTKTFTRTLSSECLLFSKYTAP